MLQLDDTSGCRVFRNLMDDPGLANDPSAAVARETIAETMQCDASTFAGSRVRTSDQVWVVQEQIRTIQSRSIASQRDAEQTQTQLAELQNTVKQLYGSTGEQAEALRAQIDGATVDFQSKLDLVSGVSRYGISRGSLRAFGREGS